MPGPRVTAADLLPAEPTPFRWSMGVKPLEMDRWLLQDDDYDSDVAEVQQLLETRHSDIVHSLPGSHDAASEVYKAMASHLVERDPRRFGTISAGPPPIDDMTPLEAVRRWVQEDLCLLQRRPDGWTMTACAVAAPTAWDVASKVGLPLDAIHGPVPRYEQELAARMATFFDRLHPDRPVWRANRSLTDNPALRLEAPTRKADPDPTVTAENVARRVWLRVEYQTLRRFPVHDGILFTIRILRQRLDTLVDRLALVRDLVEGIDAIPSDVAGYKRSTAMYAVQLRAWAATIT
jgi:dimethylamine monooxygenase subunit A